MTDANGKTGLSELDELRAYFRAVDAWLAESDAERNEGGNQHVRAIAPLDSAERVVAISAHFLRQKFPHLAAANGSTGAP